MPAENTDRGATRDPAGPLRWRTPMSGAVFWTMLMLAGAMFAIVSAINYVASLI